MPPESPEALSLRYKLLTLALEKAVIEEDWATVTRVLDERGHILPKIEHAANSPKGRDALLVAHEAEHRLIATLASWQSSLRLEMAKISRSRHTLKQFHA